MDEYDKAFARELMHELRDTLKQIDDSLETNPREGPAFYELCRTLAEINARLKTVLPSSR